MKPDERAARSCRGCGGNMDGRPAHHRFCSWRCWEADGAAKVGVPPAGWSEDDMMDFGNGWESDDY